MQGCIYKFEKVREIPHPTQKTAGFCKFGAGFSDWPKRRYFVVKHSNFSVFPYGQSPFCIDFPIFPLNQSDTGHYQTGPLFKTMIEVGQ